MTVTLDTNVLVAAFISRGGCHDLFEYLVRHHEIACSDHILDEFRTVLTNKIRIPESRVGATELLIRNRALLIENVQFGERVC